MSVPLRPHQSFTVVRQLANHLDTGTYYVRAVIRNAYTDELLATLDLTDKGGQRFSKNWQVKGDPTGQGYYLSIVTSVYTDSGYTTKSENYGDEENTHLVSDVFAGRPSGGGGGGSTLDAYTIRRIFREEFEKVKPEPVEIPPHPPMRFDEVLSALGTLETSIKAIPTERVDLAPVLSAITSVRAAVEEKPVTPATDLSGIQRSVDALMPTLTTALRNISILLDEGQERLAKEAVKELARLFKDTEFAIAPSTAKMKPVVSDNEPTGGFALEDLAK